MGLKIRRARKSDYKFLKGHRREHFEMNFPGFRYNNVLSEKNFKKEVGKPGTFVLTLDGKVIGYLHIEAGKYLGIQMGELETIHILKKYRGKGYSHILMKFAVDYFKKKKVRAITLTTNLTNKAAIYLYHKYGFKDFRIRMKKVMK